MDAWYNKSAEHSTVEATRPSEYGEGQPALQNSRTVKQRLNVKIKTARILAEFMRYFSNWPEVWRAYRWGAELPELRLRAGLTLSHAQGDCVLFSFREMFEEQPYTSGGFYLPKATDTVLDFGANIGFFAMYLQLRAPGITVHSFEPAPATRKRLQHNLAINRLTSRVFVYPYAVSDTNGIAYLNHHAHTIERSLVVGERNADVAEAVESVTFARALELCNADLVDLLKIDIEGAELEVILGSQPNDWDRVKRVSMEYHGSRRTDCLQILTAALHERGFTDIQSVPSQFEPHQGILQASR